MIRYGNIDVPRAGIAELAANMQRDRSPRAHTLGRMLGGIIDSNQESLTISDADKELVLRALERTPIDRLEEFRKTLAIEHGSEGV